MPNISFVHMHVSFQPRQQIVLMLFTGGVATGGAVNQTYGRSTRTEYGPMDHNDAPVIEEVMNSYYIAFTRVPYILT